MDSGDQYFKEKTKRNLKINDWICDLFVVVMDTCD